LNDTASEEEQSTPLYEENGDDSESEDGGRFKSAFPMIRFGSREMIGGDSSETLADSTKRHRSSGVIGIRIIRSSGEHGKDMEQLQNSLAAADERRRTLQDRLESLQEKLEQYIIANHPRGFSARKELTEAKMPSVRALLSGSSHHSARWSDQRGNDSFSNHSFSTAPFSHRTPSIHR